MVDIQSPNPVTAKQKIEEALGILKTLGLPRGQLMNARVTLLALLGLEPETPWSGAANPRMGITPIMDFCRDHYGTKYARTPARPSANRPCISSWRHVWPFPIPTCRTDPSTVRSGAIKSKPKHFGCSSHSAPRTGAGHLTEWQATVETLKHRYAREREMNKVPLQLAEGKELYRTPGNHSRLIRAVVEAFAPRFAPGGQVIYVGDTGEKWAYFDPDALREFGGHR